MAKRPTRDRWELGYPGGHGRAQEAGYPRYSDELSDPRRLHSRRRRRDDTPADTSKDHYEDPTGYDPQAQPKQRRRRT